MRSNLQIKVGTYTGNGANDRNITGIGFRPDLVIVKGGANVACIRTKEMRGDSSMSLSSALATAADQIQELLNDGFQVGTSVLANENLTVYWYIAIRGSAGQAHFRTGNYKGDGNDARDFITGGLGFTPDLVGIFGDTVQQKVWRSSSLAGDLTSFFGGVTPTTNLVQNLQSNGFQLGTSASVNSDTLEYFFFAMKVLAGVIAVGTYTGDGTNDRNITGVGFQPDYVIIKSGSTNQARIRTSNMTADSQCAYAGATAAASDGIQSLLADGFQIGANGSVNTNGVTYYWFAFKAGNFNAPITRTVA
ncbi:MAG: hypothetical protein A2W05_07105 [Candidatus Schekmanbacteria bacterium RBG_16_38_10]|uniref:DUF7483 domain-containing protein n=1 Tax=Candidatus Schekmanbacteria bacterium RBG_16_38_10 TaxID=1817879 RepID=A0A1F7RZP3_9BACT|nr:MAG: hypothetical protein A2W05_07105 [Candidatus Schekmanbacteria bacterium RBG_16_38_10]